MQTGSCVKRYQIFNDKVCCVYIEDVTIVTHEKPKLNTFIVQGIILRGMQVDRIYYTETAEDREEWISAIQTVVDALGVRLVIYDCLLYLP